jgi:hypothetical protein
MSKLSAAITLTALLAIRAFAQTPAPTAADRSPIKVEGAQTFSTFGAFEASVLAELDRQVDAQKNTLAVLRAKYSEDNPDAETAKLNLAILQARRDALARKNADIANMRVAALLDPGMLTRGAADSLNRAAQPAAHEALFDFSKSQTITGTITQLNLVNPYSVLTVNVSGALTNVFLASANALAAAGWSRGAVKLGDQITVTGAPARGGSNILQATEASSNGKPLFSRPAVELSQDAVAAYEK